tara:strand:+ start:747 stop:911 length:165 start_codon:yes stop_codon:yes gene_type:complete
MKNISLTGEQRKKEIERNHSHYMEMVRHAKIDGFVYGLFAGIFLWMVVVFLNDL